MKKIFGIIGIMVIMMLFVGCTTDSQDQNTQNDNTQNDNTQNDDTQNDDTQNDNPQNDNTQNDDTQNDNTQNDNAQNDDTQNDNPQNDNTQNDDIITESLNTITNAISAGVPTECTINYADDTQNIQIKYWILGDNMKLETTSQGTNMVVITKNGDSYMAGDMMGVPDCNWIMFEDMGEEDYEDNDFDMETVDYSDYEDNALYTIDCQPAIFGNEKFDTPGNVCTMEDLMPDMGDYEMQ